MAKKRRAGTRPRASGYDGALMATGGSRGAGSMTSTAGNPAIGAASTSPPRPRPTDVADDAPRSPDAPAFSLPLALNRSDLLIAAASVLCALLLYSWRLNKPNVYVFDEVYHAFTAGQLAKGNKAAYLWSTNAWLDTQAPAGQSVLVGDATVTNLTTQPVSVRREIDAIFLTATPGSPIEAAGPSCGPVQANHELWACPQGRGALVQIGAPGSLGLPANPPFVQVTRLQPNVAYEWTHPALSKLIMESGIRIFGDGPWGWRGMSVLFGAVGIGLIYLFGRLMFGREVGLFAAALLLLDGLWFVQSRIGMNDIFLTVFLMTAYLFLYLALRHADGRRYRFLWLTGAMLGLAFATKWSAAYSLVLVGLVVTLREAWLIYHAWRAGDHRLPWRQVGTVVGAFALLPALIYMLGYSQFFLMGHTLSQWKELQHQMWWYHSNLKATHPWSSRWWTWPLLLKPVWYWVRYDQNAVANIFGMGNPLIWWAFLPAVAFAFFQWFDGNFRQVGLGVILLGFLGQWMPWALSPRISFMYHMLPCVPFGCLAIAYALSRMRAPRVAVLGYLLPVFVAFIYFYPLYSGRPISREYTEQHYWISAWQPR